MEDYEDKKIASKSLDRMKKCLHDEGLREGTVAGKDLTFQQGFDRGFNLGFKTGSKLGFHNGILRVLSTQSNPLDSAFQQKFSTFEPFKNPGQGLCVICSEKEENSSNSVDWAGMPLKEIIDNQLKKLFSEEKNILGENYELVNNNESELNESLN